MENPSSDYREAFEDVINCSEQLVTMSQKGAMMLQNTYGVPQDKISVIHHGVPDVPFVDSNFYKEKFNVEGLTVLLTFGLISPNKGIETALEAPPCVLEKYPDTVYIILGATHPGVKKVSGEQYRLSLERKTIDLNPNPLITVTIGMFTGSGGWIMRDGFSVKSFCFSGKKSMLRLALSVAPPI